MIADLAKLSPNQCYHTITQCLIPRPIAWILTDNDDGSLNLAPFSYFAGVASDPPLLMVSIGKKAEDELKDTRKNILERKEFVVHIPHRQQAGEVTESARTRPYGESEIAAQNLATTEFEGFALPRLADCRIAFACELYKAEDITASQAMILGKITAIYIDDDLVSEDNGRLTINAEGVDPLARLGGGDYSFMGGTTSVTRPK